MTEECEPCPPPSLQLIMIATPGAYTLDPSHADEALLAVERRPADSSRAINIATS
jgi:hypothetical protein